MANSVPVGASTPCVRLDYSPPEVGIVRDGGVPGVDAAYFSGTTATAQWLGFDDVYSGVASYSVALVTRATDADGDWDAVSNWTTVGLRDNWVFDNVSAEFEESVAYYTLVVAVDAVGHVSAVTHSSGQTYDGSPPVVTPGDVTEVSQQSVYDLEVRTDFAGSSGYVTVSCPRCSDDVSGVVSGACTFSAANQDAVTAVPVTRQLGSYWTNAAFTLGFHQPLADNTSYSVTCSCENGAHLVTTTASNVIVTDLTVPVCDLRVHAVHTSATLPLNITWSCSDDISGTSWRCMASGMATRTAVDKSCLVRTAHVRALGNLSICLCACRRVGAAAMVAGVCCWRRRRLRSTVSGRRRGCTRCRHVRCADAQQHCLDRRRVLLLHAGSQQQRR